MIKNSLKNSTILVVFICISLALKSSSPLQNKVQNKLGNDWGPSLIPLPQSITGTDEKFSLATCQWIVIKDKALQEQAEEIRQILAEKGKEVKIKYNNPKAGEPFIALKIGNVPANMQKKEAYQLSVTKKRVQITANTNHGIFNGIQTLRQLIPINNSAIHGCEITDFPAYQWRGFMIDVGRNYQSPNLIKQQIDVMAAYKLNTFHFHVTEDLAWRLQIEKYPQLTAPESMQRDKGKFYSILQVKDLVQYCRERFIEFVIEIDMPGHSAAFTRAMGVDMQSEKGSQIVKDILKEVCTTYDIKYIHIGADEVSIRNTQFLPEVTALIQRHNKQVIGWAPGGNYDDNTIRELWKNEGEKDVHKNTIKYIDSRYLYLSDMDPMNTVVTIFRRQMGAKSRGDSSVLGAEICLWNDRKVDREIDLINMNAVYPAMLAFSERTWRGGGYPGVSYAIGPDTSSMAKDFVAFEKRLIEHKHKYFARLPFQYVKQTHIHWKLFGPFPNNKQLSTAFWPETRNVSLEDSVAALNATGGTIWLRHTDSPSATSAWIPMPEINTTWYAFTRFWSNSDTTITMWLEFKNLSRSGADATSPLGEWDYMKSKFWLNGNIIPPPRWAFPGRPSGRLDEPMVDEGFYYRPPTPVNVKKGWNKILVKLPYQGNFINEDWQAPPKWMFTAIPVHQTEGINLEADELLFSPVRE